MYLSFVPLARLQLSAICLMAGIEDAMLFPTETKWIW